MFKESIAVFVKEIKCLLRDKKTFIMSLLIPFILVPSILFITDFSLKDMQGQVADNVNIAMDHTDNSCYDFFSSQDKITILDVKDPQKALDSGEIFAYVYIDKDVDKKIIKGENFNLDIKYNESSMNSLVSMPVVTEYESAYRYLVTNYEFKSTDDLRESLAFPLDLDLNENIPKIDTSALYFSIMVPMMLILYCHIGSSGTASELSVGEKERGTLEPLLSTSANRTGILFGKFGAVTFTGFASGFATVIGLWIYLVVSSGAGVSAISPITMLVLTILALFCAMLFASINLMIGVYSKSYKEAQVYLMPMSVILLVPSLFTYGLDVSQIGITELCIPVFNIVCIIKEVVSGFFNPLHLTIVFVWLVVYIAFFLWRTLKMFKKESVIFRI